MFSRATSASFDVDAMKTFTPICPDELAVPGGDEIADSLNSQAALCRLRVGCKDAHSPLAFWKTDNEKQQLDPVQGHPNLDVHWNMHAVPGTKGFELLDGLPQPIDYDFFVWKGVELDLHPYGGCYHTLDWKNNKKSTGVIEYLKVQGVLTVVVGGLALDYCVKNTALQLRDAGFDVVLNLAACRGIAPDTVATALEEMKAVGIIVVDDAATCALFN